MGSRIKKECMFAKINQYEIQYLLKKSCWTLLSRKIHVRGPNKQDEQDEKPTCTTKLFRIKLCFMQKHYGGKPTIQNILQKFKENSSRHNYLFTKGRQQKDLNYILLNLAECGRYFKYKQQTSSSFGREIALLKS